MKIIVSADIDILIYWVGFLGIVFGFVEGQREGDKIYPAKS